MVSPLQNSKMKKRSVIKVQRSKKDQLSKFKGQKNINGQSDVFAIQLSFNQNFLAESSANQMIRRSSSRSISFFQAGSSAKQMFAVPDSRSVRFSQACN
jgi:hypothetical protein